MVIFEKCQVVLFVLGDNSSLVKWGSSLHVSNFSLKWDNAPTDYGAFFRFCAYFAQVYFVEGRYPLAW